VYQKPTDEHQEETRPRAPKPIPENVPDELRERSQWVAWRYELRNREWTKVPYNTRTGKRASTNAPETWSTLAEAAEAYDETKEEPKGYDGVGYVLSKSDPYGAVDLDKCRDPETGAMAEWASEWVEAFDSYAEVSPSGSGLHVLVRGRAPNRKNQRAGAEAYSSERFFTVTGDQVSRRRDIPERQEILDRFCDKFFPKKQHTREEPTERRPVELADEELLAKARAASKGIGERFAALYDQGDFLEHPSHSEARHELLKHLAFWTAWDVPRMARMYEGSTLYAMPGYARKWARLWERECERAIAAAPRAYGQEARPSNEGGGELAPVISALRAHAATMAWEGRSGPTDRHVYDALLGIAARYGNIAKRGIIFSADMRTLALEAGTSLQTAHTSLHRLREDRGLLHLSKKGTRKRAAVYLLRYPEVTQALNTKQCVLYVLPLSKLRNPGPTTEKEFDRNGRRISQSTPFLLRRLGKLAALVVEHVSSAGERGITERELADELKRRRGNVRRLLVKVLAARLVIEGEDGRFRAPEDLEGRLQAELTESGCVDAHERDAKRYREERKAFCSRRDRVADEAPSEEDMERERLQRVQDALEVLQDPSTGPGMILKSYLVGETKTFGYVVSAVAFYYGYSGAEFWRTPVEQAVMLLRSLERQ
jgi:putative DNA primase/helicase